MFRMTEPLKKPWQETLRGSINLLKVILAAILDFGRHLEFEAKFWVAPRLISNGMGSGWWIHWENLDWKKCKFFLGFALSTCVPAMKGYFNMAAAWPQKSMLQVRSSYRQLSGWYILTDVCVLSHWSAYLHFAFLINSFMHIPLKKTNRNS